MVYWVKETIVNMPFAMRAQVWEAKHSIVLQLGLSPLVSLFLYTAKFTSVFVILFPSPSEVEQDVLSEQDLDISLLLVQLSSGNTRAG